MAVKKIVFSTPSTNSTNASNAYYASSGMNAFDYIMIAILLILIAISIYYIVTARSTIKKVESFSQQKKSAPKQKLVYIYMNGCPYCVKFDKTFEELSEDKEMKQKYSFNDKIDIKSSAAEAYSSYKCNGFPCYMVFDQDDKLVKQGTGFRSASDFKGWLSS